jgi:hypothetical protein
MRVSLPNSKERHKNREWGMEKAVSSYWQNPGGLPVKIITTIGVAQVGARGKVASVAPSYIKHVMQIPWASRLLGGIPP